MKFENTLRNHKVILLLIALLSSNISNADHFSATIQNNLKFITKVFIDPKNCFGKGYSVNIPAKSGRGVDANPSNKITCLSKNKVLELHFYDQTDKHETYRFITGYHFSWKVPTVTKINTKPYVLTWGCAKGTDYPYCTVDSSGSNRNQNLTFLLEYHASKKAIHGHH